MNEGWARNVSGVVRWATLFTIRDTHFPRFTSFRSVHYPFHSPHNIPLNAPYCSGHSTISLIYLFFLLFLLSLRLHFALYLSFRSIPFSSLRVFHFTYGKLLSYTHSVRVSLFPTLRFGRVPLTTLIAALMFC